LYKSRDFARHVPRRQAPRQTLFHDSVIAFTPNLRCLHPFWPMQWTIFFIKKFGIHSVGITLHRQRSIAKMRQQDWRDPDVVIDHLAFGETDFRVKNLVQVRNRELFSFNHEFSFLWHTILSCRHPELLHAKNRSGVNRGCGLQMRATQCSQVSCPLRISISTRKKKMGTSVFPSKGNRTASFSVVTTISRSRRIHRLMKLRSSASV